METEQEKMIRYLKRSSFNKLNEEVETAMAISNAKQLQILNAAIAEQLDKHGWTHEEFIAERNAALEAQRKDYLNEI